MFCRSFPSTSSLFFSFSLPYNSEQLPRVWRHAAYVCFYVRRARCRLPHLLDDDLAVLVDGAVVDHAHYGHAQVAPDAEGDAEAQAAQDGDDVAAGQTAAVAVAQRGLLLRGLPGPPVLRQLDHLARLLPLLHHPVNNSQGGRQCL